MKSNKVVETLDGLSEQYESQVGAAQSLKTIDQLIGDGRDDLITDKKYLAGMRSAMCTAVCLLEDEE